MKRKTTTNTEVPVCDQGGSCELLSILVVNQKDMDRSYVRHLV